MIRNLRAIGNSCGVIIDSAILELFGLGVGSPVEITVAPDGKGLTITPVVGGEKAEHKARVREAAARITKKHSRVLKKLAE